MILSVDHGTLDIRTDVAGGVTANEVTGDGTGTVTLIASQYEIDATLAAMNGLIYRGALNFNGVDTLTVTSNDLGSSGFTLPGDRDARPARPPSLSVRSMIPRSSAMRVRPAVRPQALHPCWIPDLRTVSDVDLDARNGGAGNYAGASFTVERQTTPNANDVFGFQHGGHEFHGQRRKFASRWSDLCHLLQ